MSQAHAAETIVIEAMAEAPIALPDDPAYLTAEYFRDGSDLVIRTKDGAETLVSGYFDLEAPVDLIVSGAAIAGRVVGALARPEPREEAAPTRTAEADKPADAPTKASADGPAAPEPRVAAEALGEPIGQIGEIHGEAFAKRADGQVVPLAAGDPIYEEDVISTGAEAALGLVFSDGMTFSLGSETRMVLDEFRYDAAANEGGGLFSVLAGEFSFVSGAAAATAEDALMIDTPTMTIGVRGTKVLMQIGSDGEASRIALLAEEDGTVGQIMVMTEAGEQLMAEPNRMVEITSRFEAPSPAKQIESADIVQFFGEALAALPAPKEFFEPKVDAPNPAPASPATQALQQQAEAEAAAVQAEAAVQTADAAKTLVERVEAQAEELAEAIGAADEDAAEAAEQEADFAAVAERLQELAAERAAEEPEEFIEAMAAQAEESPVMEALEEARATAEAAIDAAAEAAAEAAADAREVAIQDAVQETVQDAVQADAPAAPTPNAAPVLDPSADPSFAAVEDGGAQIMAVQNLVAQSGSADADADGAAVGIAVTGLGSGGAWAYSLDDGATFQAFGAPSDAAAVLLDDAAVLRFEPAGDFNGAASLNFRAWDGSAGASGDVDVDVSGAGGSSAYSAQTATATVTVAPVNDAPTLGAGGAQNFASITEDATGHNGDRVADIVAAEAIADADGAAAQAIAVVGADQTNGTWSFSLDGGGSWTALGDVSDGSALLLDAAARLRFEPASEYVGDATLSFRAWDQSAGAVGDRADASVAGGSSAFSTASATATVTVAAANDAPTITTASVQDFANVAEDASGHNGDRVDDLLGEGAIQDADGTPAQAIAVVGADQTNGTWSFSLDGGGSWTALGAVSDGAALLLDAVARLRFEPARDFVGDATLSFRAWDQSAGAVGDRADASAPGGSSAFSAAAATATASVSGSNDAPSLTSSAVQNFAAVTEDATGGGGDKVSDLLGAGAISDPDGSPAQAIAVVGADGTNGTWSYSIDDGGSWTALGVVSDGAALLLDASARLRFEPAGNFTGGAGLSFRAWDQSAGAVGDRVDATAPGGASAFSSEQATAIVTVTAVNDAPVLDTVGAPVFTPIVSNAQDHPGDTVADMLVAGSISDADGAAAQAIAVTGVDHSNGDWQYSLNSGASWTNMNDASGGSALLLDAAARIRFVPNENYVGDATITFRAWDKSAGAVGDRADASVNGPSSPFSSAADAATVTVGATSAAPVLKQASFLTFDGDNDYIDVGDPGSNSDALDLKSGHKTVEAWFYYDGDDEESMVLFSKGAHTHNDVGYSALIDDGELVLRVFTGPSGGRAATTINLGDQPGWQHVAMVIDGSSTGGLRTVTGYLNGSDAGWSAGYDPHFDDDIFGAPPGGLDIDDSFIIGGALNGGGNGKDLFEGGIADVRVWDKARTGPEIEADMTSELDGTESGLVAHFPLDAVSGTSTSDGVSGIVGSLAQTGAVVSKAIENEDGDDDTISGRLVVDDPDGGAVTVTLIDDAEGRVTFDANTLVWTYTADAGDGSLPPPTVTYQATDEHGASSTLTFAIPDL